MATSTVAAAATAARSITRLLTTPRQVANILDWRRVSGSILTLTLSRDNSKLDLGVSWHPSRSDDDDDDAPLVQLASVPLLLQVEHKTSKVLCSSVARELDGICERFSICGMVVHWPVEKDGWCGYSCGRVLFTLDQLARQSKAVKTRPVCLWDHQQHHRHVHHHHQDEWGRSTVYSRQTDGSIEQYGQQLHADDTGVTLANLWRDFCQAQWPELYRSDSNKKSRHEKSKGKKKKSATPNHAPPVLSSWLDSSSVARNRVPSCPKFVHL
jgi:hypothetical protein